MNIMKLVRFCVLSVFALCAFGARAEITARYTFDDAGNGGLNMLKASIGADAIVRGGSPAADVNGLGALYPTNGVGGGALAIPVGQFLAIPHGLVRSTGQAWFLRMRMRIPDTRQHALLQLDQTNRSDAFLFERGNGSFGGSANWGAYKDYAQGVVGVWRTILLSCDGTATSVYVDGTPVVTTKEGATYAGGSDLTNVEYFYISGDNSGEDNLVLVDEILVGSGSYFDQVVDIPSAGDVSYDGQPHQSGLADTADYTVTSNVGGTDRGFYPVTVSLVDPVNKCWDDGTTADRTVWFAIRDALVPELTEHLAFDDPADPLKATVGEDACVREGNPSVAVAGLGDVTAVSGEGRSDGTGAVAVPMGQFIVARHGLVPQSGTRWQIDFRCRVPESATYHTLFSVGTNNTGDAALHIRENDGLGNSDGWGGYVYDVLPFQKWNTVSVRSDGRTVSAWANGSWVINAIGKHLQNFPLTPHFGISSDNYREDALMEFDDVKVFAQKACVRVAPPVSAGSFVWTGAPIAPTLDKSLGYAVRGAFAETDPGLYEVPVGLLDPMYAVWSDTGFSGDRVVTFAISREANAWVTEPTVGTTCWSADRLPPAFNPGEAAHGTVSVLLDGLPLSGQLPSAPGVYTLTFATEPTVEFAGLEKSFALTVLPSGADVPVEVTSAAYVTNGLVMLLDGIDNVGFGRHDDKAATWTDLSGNGYDWTVNPTHGSFERKGLYMAGTGLVATNAVACRPDFKSRMDMVEFVWRNERSDHGIIFGPGFMYSAYLYTDDRNHVGFFGGTSKATSVGVPVTLGETMAYSATYLRSGETPSGVSDVRTNGVAVAATETMNNYWNGGMGDYPAMGALTSDGNNRRAKGLLSSLRVYSPALSADERTLNSAIDRIRFGTGVLPASIGVDGYKVEDGAILVRVAVSSVNGKVSLEGRPYGYSDAIWVPLGAVVTIDGKFRGRGGLDPDGFERTGLPSDTVFSADGKRLTFAAAKPVTATITHPDAVEGMMIILK